ncbi:MAG TPA: AbrB/MazE/SpoVT family DNA-binding domain-containing protein [Kiritimatiellia bacterium]|jgi:AbrB family looped-hinge helix DNA binding protein|nr:AbrB/MazE/SpoVT family DNA-binding domain-containing protein [Kiritimatiellia bacterium]HOE35917.1 AbrB/MazE/SpoVT family DNA-binding domain-containing protein [Kiritimatiellia bacterium]HOR74832.1 AbrB/MazE/SpoVT family DNA-binding domain-containing protein [Kiritimatiellia bacterium]HOU59315.1 AbrB/MazE/SpoVT family DNA-binding domain-containing protein [Kiritimatiellia bacterium]HPK68914.1 AbrB/MazE/SpoVT family DNA-binding domain-containing protein [Kiritimatiellia bacterium]
MVTGTLTSKGQITIPKSIRDSLNLQTGDRLAFSLVGDKQALLQPITTSVDDVYGVLHRPGQKAKSIEDMNRSITRRHRQAKS